MSINVLIKISNKTFLDKYVFSGKKNIFGKSAFSISKPFELFNALKQLNKHLYSSSKRENRVLFTRLRFGRREVFRRTRSMKMMYIETHPVHKKFTIILHSPVFTRRLFFREKWRRRQGLVVRFLFFRRLPRTPIFR